MTRSTLTQALALSVLAAVSGPAAAQPAGATIKIEQPWSRATPAGATVAGGYVKLTNTGKEKDRLIGGTFARAKSVEVHMMTNDMGVMKMRHMTEGVDLPSGVSVELKPGGVHLMLLGLTETLKAGETVDGTLRFEKAGAIHVTFAIAPLGAEGPSSGAGHDHNEHDGHQGHGDKHDH